MNVHIGGSPEGERNPELAQLRKELESIGIDFGNFSNDDVQHVLYQLDMKKAGYMTTNDKERKQREQIESLENRIRKMLKPSGNVEAAEAGAAALALPTEGQYDAISQAEALTPESYTESSLKAALKRAQQEYEEAKAEYDTHITAHDAKYGSEAGSTQISEKANDALRRKIKALDKIQFIERYLND